MIESNLVGKIRASLSPSDAERFFEVLGKFQLEALKPSDSLKDAKCIVGYSTIVVILSFQREDFSSRKYVLKMAQSSPGWGDWAKSRIGYEYESTKLVFNKFEENHNTQVIEPVCFYPSEYAIIFDFFDGDSCDNLLRQAMNIFSGAKFEDRAIEACEQAGKWLKTFQTLCRPDPVNLLSSDHVQEKLDALFLRVPDQFRSNFVNGYRDKIERFAHAQFDLMDNEDKLAAFKHNDFAPWNVLYSSDAIKVIDFADLELDTAFYDYFYFLRSIDVIQSKLGSLRHCSNSLKRAFRSGYGVEEDCKSPLALFYQTLLDLERIKTLYNALEPTPKRPVDLARQIHYKNQLRSLKGRLSRQVVH